MTDRIAVVTGAGGFLGANLVRRLLDDGFAVRALDLNAHGFATALGALADAPNLSFTEGDVLDLPADDKLYSEAGFIFHCAGIADHVPSSREPERYLRANVHGVMRVAEAARHAGGGCKLVYPSSAAVYGVADWPTTEQHPIRPINPYGLSKWMGEEVVDTWQRLFDVPTISFRVFNGYGPGAVRSSIVNFFIQKMLDGEPLTITGDGSQQRDFIFIDDIVDAFVAGALSAHSGKTFNLATGHLSTMRSLAEAIGGKIEFIAARPNEPKVICPDITSIQSDLGWSAKVSLQDGVAKTVSSMAAALK